MYADLALRLPSTSARWRGPEFRSELEAWVVDALGEPTSSLTPVRDRPWSTVWRVTTDSGVHFAKQNTPTQAFEARLLTLLAGLAPAYVVPLTAADPDRDLLLTPDQGRVLADSLAEASEKTLLETTSRVLRAAAELQREVAARAAELVAAGLVRLAAADALPYVQQRLDDFATLSPTDPRSLEPGQAGLLEASLPAIAAAVDEVASLGLPLTLQHNDLHTSNVFEVDGQLRFFDFGDAMLSEPLAALMVPLRGLAHRLELAEDDPRLLRVAEPALEVWSDLAPMRALRSAVPPAARLARLARCESWVRCSASMTVAELDEWGDSAGYWLAEAVN